MHKFFLFIVFVFLSCQVLIAQEQWDWVGSTIDKSYRIELGPKIGLGMSYATQPTNYNFSVNGGLSFQLGASANVHFGRRYAQSPGGTGVFGVETEILYVLHNIKFDGIENAMTMHCVALPILFQIYPIPNFAIEIGPTFTKILKCAPEQIQFDDMILNTGQLSGGDIMLTAGITYKTSINLMFDLRYNWGFSNLAGNFDSRISSTMISMIYFLISENKRNN